METSAHRERHSHRERHTWKGALAGMVGGFVASWTMNQFQAALTRATEATNPEMANGASTEPDDATVKVASALSESLLDRPLTTEEKRPGGSAVHYAFGTLMGGLYGALAEVSPSVTSGRGVPFGTILWLGADEVAVPALGLSSTPNEAKPSMHLAALTAHLVYGVATDLVRRMTRTIL